MPRWAELAEAAPEPEIAEAPRGVWIPTTESFLSTLLDCVKEQAGHQAAAEASAATGLLDLHVDAEPEEELPAAVAAREPIAEALQSTVVSFRRPPMCRWNSTRAAAAPSVENSSPITIVEAAAEIEEIPVDPASLKAPVLARFTFMQPAIDPSACETVPVIMISDAEGKESDEIPLQPASLDPSMWTSFTFQQSATPSLKSDEPVAAEAQSAIGEIPVVLEAKETAAAIDPVFAMLLAEEIAAPEIPVSPEVEVPPPAEPQSAAAPLTPVFTTLFGQKIEVGRHEQELPKAAVIEKPAPAPAPVEISTAEAEAAVAEPEVTASSTKTAKAKPATQPANGVMNRVISLLSGKHGLRNTKQLRVAETISLGDKRFVAVVHVDGQKFLIGGGTSGVSLLTQLDSAQNEAGLPAGSCGAGEQV
ncbi:MAG TPA: flagellar biosynthetic protein FliO [Acidobacteriaceae bacterium]|nr:flagellar biosynthetic protein FliO [Acidobacteriaceae bacterium]